MKYGYIGILPSNVRHDSRLKPFDKLLYSEITASMVDGYCIKSNTQFAKLFDVTTATISSSLSSLRSCFYIFCVHEHEKNSKAVKRRCIYLTPPKEITTSNDYASVPCTNYFDGGIPVNADIVESDTQSDTKNLDRYYNNIIYRDYINPSKKFIPLLKELNEKQITYLGNIVHEFYTEKHKHFPQAVKANWKKDDCLVNDSINTLYMIIKLDDYSETIVRDVIKWATNDKFWYSNLISLRGLRNKSNNGQTKFTNIYLKYKGRK